MSFSSDVKNEITKKYTNEKSALAELTAMICFGGKLKKGDNGYYFYVLTENPRTARRVYSLLKGTLEISSRIKIRKTSEKSTYYEVLTDNEADIERLFEKCALTDGGRGIGGFVSYRISPRIIPNRETKKAFVRGAFIAGGSVMNPKKNYHLEFTTSRYGLANDFSALLGELGIPPKSVMRKSKYVLYYKSCDDITDVLSVLGAVNSLMEYHNAKIVKEVRNNVNRTINCETANMNKTIDASVEQTRSIKKLMEKGVFDTLPDSLREIAELRLKYPDYSLKELGEAANPPIGKSGVNHRLRKILDIAENC